MHERTTIHSPEPRGQHEWLDRYLPHRPLAPGEPRASTIDFAFIRGLVHRQRWLVAGVIFAAVLVGLAATLLTTPMYEAQATVKVEPYGANIVAGQDVNADIASNQVHDYLATQVEIIRSRQLARSVAETLNLGARDGFLDRHVDGRRPPDLSDREWLKRKNEMAASLLVETVVADKPQGNWVIAIRYRSDDPDLAAEIANAYADAFMAFDSTGSLEFSQYALDYLEEQIRIVRDRLERAERAENAYARQSGIIVQPPAVDGEDQGGGATATLTSANLARINARVSTARANLIDAEQRWRSIQNLPASQLPEVQGNPVIQGLVSQRAAKQVELAELRQRYNDDLPPVANVLAQVSILDEQIERIGSDIKAAVRHEYIVARNQERALAAELDDLTGASLRQQDLQVRYTVLEREAQALRDQLKALLDRYNEVNSAAEVEAGTISRIDSAIAPSAPYSPNVMRNLAIALAIGAALAGGLAVLRETFDDRIRSLDDIEERLGLPLLGHTPHVSDLDIGADGTGRSAALMEAYSSVRAAIEFSLPRNRNVLQLTSSQPGEGKSLTAVILAELFASLGRKTLLIDTDLRRPSVAGLVGIDRPRIGVVEAILGHAELGAATIKGRHENLEILPVGEVPPNPSDILASENFRDLVKKCRNEYALVLLDSSPVLGLADAPVVANVADATIFVLEANKVPFGQARTAVSRLRGCGGKVAGVVLTKYRALEAGQSYAYQYGYYQYGPDRQATEGQGLGATNELLVR